MRASGPRELGAGIAAAGPARAAGRNPVRWAAAVWGAVVFFPVGINYVALVLTLIAFAARAFADPAGEGGLAARWRRVRGHPLFWPLAFFFAWTAVVLLVAPRYPETPGNALHGLRIVVTLACALALARDELAWALRGFLVGLGVSALVVFVHQTIGLPDFRLWGDLAVWSNLREVMGNKSISNAILFAFFGAAAFALALDARGARRAICLALWLIAFAIVVWALPSRTGVVILLVAAPVAAIHRFSASLAQAAVATVASVLVAATLVASAPAARDRLAQGWTEVQAAIAGDVSPTSWGLRLTMIRHSVAMIAERPVFGWGIGGWSEQWRLRAPATMVHANMPHNDFLWMGAQAGVIGALAVAVLALSAARRAARRPDFTGRLGLMAIVAWVVAISVNSAMRDAVIGLSLLWVVGLALRALVERDGVPLGAVGETFATRAPASDPGPTAAGAEPPAADADAVLVLVINLDRSADRLVRIGARLEALGVRWQRLAAVDGAALDPDARVLLDERAYRQRHGRQPLPGELGCYLSHLRAMETFLATEAPFALILEDDVVPGERLPDTLPRLLRVTGHWDMVKLSKVHSGTPVALRRLGDDSTLDVMLTRCTGSSAYLVNRRAASAYLRLLLPMTLPYDHAFDRGWELGLKVRLASPPPCMHDELTDSTIAPIRGRGAAVAKPRWFRRLPAFRHRLANETRRVVHGIGAIVKNRVENAR